MSKPLSTRSSQSPAMHVPQITTLVVLIHLAGSSMLLEVKLRIAAELSMGWMLYGGKLRLVNISAASEAVMLSYN